MSDRPDVDTLVAMVESRLPFPGAGDARVALRDLAAQARGWRLIAEDTAGVLYVKRAEAAEARVAELAAARDEVLRQIGLYDMGREDEMGLSPESTIEAVRAALDGSGA